jgi:hypothetical protein
MSKAQPTDLSGISLQGTLNGIPKVQNITTYSGIWYPITMEYEESKAILLQPRGVVDWYFSTISGGSYFTFRKGATLRAPIVTVSGEIICWVMSDTDITFELLVGV